jgi:hypothetical protein
MGGDVRCDICTHWIPGEVRFLNDNLVCQECYKTLKNEEDKKSRIPTVALLATYVVSSGVTLFVDTWPLVDVTSFLVALGSGFMLGGRVYERIVRGPQ